MGTTIVPMVLVAWGILFLAPESRAAAPLVTVRDFADGPEAERLIAATLRVPATRRVPFVSAYFLGRAYHPETKRRIKQQRSADVPKLEATNRYPLPLEILRTSLTYLDCMTYVEHVLALAASERPDYRGVFLPRLVDVMADGHGETLMNHHRSHFTSHWADVNERKGYLRNIARGHALAARSDVLLNKVAENRTFYVEDRFMISDRPQRIDYFPSSVVLAGKAPLQSGDVVAMVCTKEGLDVVHMGFYIVHHGTGWLRHASYSRNRVVDENFDEYVAGAKSIEGLMVLRPILAAPTPPPYRFVARRGRQTP